MADSINFEFGSKNGDTQADSEGHGDSQVNCILNQHTRLILCSREKKKYY